MVAKSIVITGTNSTVMFSIQQSLGRLIAKGKQADRQYTQHHRGIYQNGSVAEQVQQHIFTQCWGMECFLCFSDRFA